MLKKLLCIIIFIFFLFVSLYSQNKQTKQVFIILTDTATQSKYKFKETALRIIDSTELFKKLSDLKSDLIKAGYLAASIDSLTSKNTDYQAYLNIGPLFKWGDLSFNNIDNEALKISGIKKTNFKNNEINYEDYKNKCKLLLNYYENIGYPFAQLEIENLLIKNYSLKGILHVSKNQKFYFDTILIKGKVKISRKLIYKYIAINPGDLFNQKKIDRLDEYLNKLAYIKIAKPTELEFFNKRADIHIYLKKRKSNLFKGIIGFATDENDENKLKLTGNVKFDLNNSFGIGEHIALRWENYKDSSQFLSSIVSVPYLFFLPLGIKASFQLDKELLDYLNVNYSMALTYDINPSDKVEVYLNGKHSYIIDNDAVTQTGLDNITIYTFGLTIGIDKTDRIILARKGFKLQVSSGYGNRWTDQSGNSSVLEADFFAAYYWQLTKSLTLSLKNNSKLISNNIGFYENEMLKIGGIESIRGFDEKSIHASAYSFFSFEPRFFISSYSFVSIFTDFIYFEKTTPDLKKSNYGLGIGSGISIDSKAGIFSLSFAVGKLGNYPFRLSTTKIHFGYVARF